MRGGMFSEFRGFRQPCVEPTQSLVAFVRGKHRSNANSDWSRPCLFGPTRIQYIQIRSREFKLHGADRLNFFVANSVSGFPCLGRSVGTGGIEIGTGVDPEFCEGRDARL